MFARTIKTLSTLFMLTALLAGCSNASTVADEPVRSGESRSFSAPYATLKSVTPGSIKETGVHITQQNEIPEGTTILVSQGVSAFSWGNVGRVFIEKSEGPNTTVYVTFERRFSGTENSSFSEKLFKTLDSDLKAKNSAPTS